MPEIDATETIITTDAIDQKRRCRTIQAILREETLKTPLAINTLIATLATADHAIINTVLRVVYIISVQAILVPVTGRNEIAVFGSGYRLVIVAIDTLAIHHESKQRYSLEKNGELLKKTLPKIKFLGIQRRIPAIGPPFFIGIDNLIFIRGKH